MRSVLIVGFLLVLAVVFYFRSKPSPSNSTSAEPEAAIVTQNPISYPAKAAPTKPSLSSKPSDKTSTKPPMDPRFRRALELLHEGRRSAAIDLLNELIRLEPNNAAALTELAMIHLSDPKESALAMDLLERALHSDPENEAALEELLRLQSRQGERAAADGLLELVKKYPDSANLAGAYGKTLLAKNRADEATGFLKKAVESGAASDDLHLALADAYRRQGNSGKEAEALDKLVAKQEAFLARHGNDKTSANEWAAELAQNTMRLARALIRSSQFDRVESLLRSAAERNADPKALEILYEELQSARSERG